MFICQAIAAPFSGFLAGSVGRKRAMFLINFIHIIGWATLYYAPTVPAIFTGMCLLGLGNGLMTSPIVLYIGEIS